MHILLLNDTSEELNPGCRAVSSTLKESFMQGHTIRSVPLGIWADEVRDIPGVRVKCIIKRETGFPVADQSTQKIDLSKLRERTKALWTRDQTLRELFSWADIVVMNGEGSIHHNFPRGIALLSLALESRVLEKPVCIVNTTIMHMDGDLLREALRGSVFIHVRGMRSRNELPKELDALTRVAPDIVCGADFLPVESVTAQYDGLLKFPLDKYCLFAPGVASTLSSAEEAILSIQGEGFIPLYLRVGDGADRGLWQLLSDTQPIEGLDLGTIDWRILPALFSRFRAAVSGRHHLNIFFVRAGLPFIALPSNTWKIEETLEQFSLPIMIAENGAAVSAFLSGIESIDRIACAQTFHREFEKARSSVITMRDDFQKILRG